MERAATRRLTSETSCAVSASDRGARSFSTAIVLWTKWHDVAVSRTTARAIASRALAATRRALGFIINDCNQGCCQGMRRRDLNQLCSGPTHANKAGSTLSKARCGRVLVGEATCASEQKQQRGDVNHFSIAAFDGLSAPSLMAR